MFLPFESQFTFCIASDALSVIVVKLRFDRVRRAPTMTLDWLDPDRFPERHTILPAFRDAPLHADGHKAIRPT
jgi:hypothetical protein